MKEHATNEKATHIILYLADNPKSTGKTIADKTDLSESDVSKHLNNLKKENILDNQTCPTQEGKNYSGKCWHVNPDPETFHTLLNEFVGTKYQDEFFQSLYVKKVDIHNPEIDRIAKKTISNHLKNVRFMVNAFYPDIPLADHLNLALSSDARWKHWLEGLATVAAPLLLASEVVAADEDKKLTDEDKESLRLIAAFFYALYISEEPTAFDSTGDSGKLDLNFESATEFNHEPIKKIPIIG